MIKNPNLRYTDMADYKFTKGKGLPTRELCDLDDPREMFAWMLVAPPGLNGAPIPFPDTGYLMMLSEHFYECGAMIKCEACGHERTPEKKYRTPSTSEPNWATSPGRWVPHDDPDPVREPAKAVWGDMQMMQKAELVQAIMEDDNFWERLPVPYKDKLRQVVDST